MQYEDLLNLLEHTGKDPARLIFEDELTGISNRRFLRNYLEHKVAWAEPETRLSLLMLDLDGFKEINDTYGHEVGDAALVWVAEQLRDVAGAHGLPIRYAGDEFIVLMPHSGRAEAVEMAERLVGKLSETAFPGPGGKQLTLEFSVGIATAPQDGGDGTSLIRRADAALYAAKAQGGHRHVVAAEVHPQQIAETQALQQLDGAEMAGRGSQFARVSDALERFSLRESQFMVLRGSPGLGKSAFLEATRARLSRSTFKKIVSIHGRPEELFRPYYLAADLLVALMSQREDKGLSVLEGLSPEQRSYAAQILPQLGGDDEAAPRHEQSLRREFIFNTLLLLIFRAVDFRPLIVLIDDLHFADEATLNVLRVLMHRAEVPLFVCATTMDSDQPQEELPLERFLRVQRDELALEEVELTPLSPAEVSSHMRAMFPGISMPDGFETRLYEVIQGNPLFLSEILRKLVMEQKIALVGQRWTVRPMSADELPRSLEEVVSEKIAVLDEEGQKLLAQASVIGENVQVSALAGTSETMEARVFEFLDQAVHLGLLNSEFEVNDESIHFISRRVLDIVYGKLEEPQKQELHERAGNYQELLYQRKLMPSASILAYHFACSENEEKTRNYERIKNARDEYVFSPEEAVAYSGESLPDCPPLDEESRLQAPAVLRWMLTAVNNIRLYPAESEAIISATQELQSLLGAITERVEVLDIQRLDGRLLLNGTPIDISESELVVEGALNLMRRLELRGLSIRLGVLEEELGPLLVAFARTRPEEIDQEFWQRFVRDYGLTHIDLRQLRYTRVRKVVSSEAPQHDETPEKRAFSPPPAGEATIDSEERAEIRELIRCLLAASRGVRLYPVRSRAIAAAKEQLAQALERTLQIHPQLTVAAAGDAILVNARRLGGVDVESLAAELRDFMVSVKLAGLTFVSPVPEAEIDSFIAGLRDLPDLATDELFWSRFEEERGLAHIHVHESLYQVKSVGAALSEVPGEKEEELEAGASTPEPEQEAADDRVSDSKNEEDLGPFLDALAERVDARIRADDGRGLGRLVERLFGDFHNRDAGLRERTVVACRVALGRLDPGSQPIFARSVAEPMLEAFASEDHPDVLRLIAAMVRRMSTVSIQFAEYSLACGLLTALYPPPGVAVGSVRARALAQVLKPELDQATQDLIVDDFNSPDIERQQGAARLLGALGPAAEALLAEVIKTAQSRRVRQIAANLLAEAGGDAGDLLKRAFAFEELAERKVRMLEVLDSVTRDVSSELACALADDDAEVRKAALRLAERVADPEIVEIVQEQARGRQAGAAAMAIRWLAQLKPRGAAGDVLEILRGARDSERVIACCQALGELGDSSAVKALSRLLAPRRPFSLRRAWEPGVRNAAALALAQLSGEEARLALSRHVEDSDPAVRRIARNARPA